MSASARNSNNRLLLALSAVTLLLLTVAPAPTVAVNAGDPLDLAQFKGRVVYLDFWASWCTPCRYSFPWMNRLQGELGHDGLVVIAVNVDRESADAERFLRQHAAQFRIVYDPDGLLAEKYGVHGMPTSFLIDRSGHVQARHEGFLLRDRDVLTQQIQALVLAH
jgi:cytochrome c biogenesis protein CcmG, thiol:disulfide interchange protein DsbE